MASPYGITYATGALSSAISDLFKGLNEGEDERRKNEAMGMQQREALANEAYQPIRFKQGQLQNQQTEQNIDIAGKQEGRAAGAYAEQQARWPIERRALEATTKTSEVGAQYAEQQAIADLNNKKASYDQLQEEIKAARIRYPYLEEQLTNQARKLKLEIDTDSFKLTEAQQHRARRDEASTALLAAGTNLDKIEAALAKYGGNIDPNDPYVRFLLARVEAQARAENRLNPLSVYSAKVQTMNQVRDDARADAQRLLLGVYGAATMRDPSTEPGFDEALAWANQYSYARRLRQSENPSLGITFSDAEKNIPAMPSSLKTKLAGNPGMFSSILGTPAGYQKNLDIANRMDAYLSQGMEWTEAKIRATQDHDKAENAKPGTAPKSTWEIFKEAIPGAKSILGGPDQPVPEKSLPPKVAPPGPSPEMTRRNKLNEISQFKYDVPWEVLLHPGNEAAKKWVEDELKRQEEAPFGGR